MMTSSCRCFMVAALPAPSITQVAQLSVNITIYDTRYADCRSDWHRSVHDCAPAVTPGLQAGGYPAVLASL